MKVNLKGVQLDDELGIHRAKSLSDFEAQLWFDIVKSTVEHDTYISTDYFKENLECRETGGSDIAVWAVEIALKYVLEDAVEAVREWFPERIG